MNEDEEEKIISLKKIQHKGITGTLEFDAKGDLKEGTLTIFTFRGGKREMVQVVK